ncbi:MAG: archaeal heat shock protein Hsp14 [Thermoprotei archaeon]
MRLAVSLRRVEGLSMVGLEELSKRLANVFPTQVYPKELYELLLPPVDVYDDPSGLIVEVDLAGFKKEDVSVSVSGRMLSIRAHRELGDARSYHVRQRPVSLNRTVTLPYAVDTSVEIAARYENGTLVLTLPVKGVRTVKIA